LQFYSNAKLGVTKRSSAVYATGAKSGPLRHCNLRGPFLNATSTVGLLYQTSFDAC